MSETIKDAAAKSLAEQQNVNALATTKLTRSSLEKILTEMEPRIKQTLPKHITAERILRLAINAYSRTPKLHECTPTSIIGSIVLASQVGLEPDGTLGQGYLVPFYNGKMKRYEAQFIPGYQGLMDLGFRSGKILNWEAHAVREKDVFTFEYGTNKFLTHKPGISERGEITCFYSIVTLSNGIPNFIVMSKEEVDKIRAMSKGKDGFAWQDHYEEMGIKSVIRRHSKKLPRSSELARAVALDEMVEAGIPQGADVTKADETGTLVVASFEEEGDDAAKTKSSSETQGSHAEHTEQQSPEQQGEPIIGQDVAQPPSFDEEVPSMEQIQEKNLRFLLSSVKTAKSQKTLDTVRGIASDKLKHQDITKDQYEKVYNAILEKQDAVSPKKQ